MSTPRSRAPFLLALGPTVFLGGCTEGSSEQTTPASAPVAVFSPDSGELPLPNDLLFLESIDGTLNLDPAEDPDEQNLVDALSALDGWSTVAPIRFPFSAPLDPQSVVLGQSVRVFEVELDTAQAFVGAPVREVLGELSAADFELSLRDGGRQIVLAPLRPLPPVRSYLALVTRQVRAQGGATILPSIVFDLAANGAAVAQGDELYDLQQRLLAEDAALSAFGVDPGTRLISTAFTTQSIDAVQQALVAIATGQEAEFVAELGRSHPFLDFGSDLSGPAAAAAVGIEGEVEIPLPEDVPFWLARFYRGWLEVPYFLDTAQPGATPTDTTQDDRPLSSHFRARFAFGSDDTDRHLSRFNLLPASTGPERIPLFVSVPFGTKPPGGWPVVIFQHGITGDRTNLLGLASTLGLARFVGVAIDLPLHGVVDDGHVLFAGYADGPGVVRERCFGLDLWTENDDGDFELGEDGIADSSGAHFVQLEHLRTTRDHLKQAVSDLLHLRTVLGQIDLDGDGLPDLDTARVSFVGHSLGAITGVLYLPFAEAASEFGSFVSATLGMPGGGLAALLAASEKFGPDIEEGLAEQGIAKGSAEFDAFLDVAQAVVDSADPVNHAAALVASGLPLHLIEVVGEEGLSPPDQTVPNAVDGWPLSGTDPLIEALELPTVTSTTVNPAGVRAAVRFLRGDHVSLLIPSDFQDLTLLAVWQEMQTQTVEFLFHGGQILTIVDSGLLAPE
jgi:hypothetical protein